MSSQTFQMLLQSHYTDDENNIKKLHVEHLVKEQWQTFELDNTTPGFDTFIYAILSCQHMYFRLNAAEYGLTLNSSEGLITVIADQYRSIETLNIEFKGKLKTGEPSQTAVDSIIARMHLCPVSINLKDIPHNNITASFETD